MPLRCPLILASASPRRQQLLEQLGLDFEIIPASGETPPQPGEHAETYVQRAAEEKAAEVFRRNAAQRACVLAADTVVVLDGKIFGKPKDDTDALAMLTSLAGRWHHVWTGVRAIGPELNQSIGIVVTTRVLLREADLMTLERYVRSGEGRDKAGSYAIQGLGAGLVQAIDGSYGNVVGLPTVETLQLLSDAHVLATWP